MAALGVREFKDLTKIQNAYQQMGVQFQVGNTAPMKVAGRDCTVVNISAMTQNGLVGGAINIIPTRTGMMTFAIGGPQQTCLPKIAPFHRRRHGDSCEP